MKCNIFKGKHNLKSMQWQKFFICPKYTIMIVLLRILILLVYPLRIVKNNTHYAISLMNIGYSRVNTISNQCNVRNSLSVQNTQY